MSTVSCIHCNKTFEPTYAKEAGAYAKPDPGIKYKSQWRVTIRVLCPYCKGEMVGYSLVFTDQSWANRHVDKVKTRVTNDELPPAPHYTTY